MLFLVISLDSYLRSFIILPCGDNGVTSNFLPRLQRWDTKSPSGLNKKRGWAKESELPVELQYALTNKVFVSGLNGVLASLEVFLACLLDVIDTASA